MILYEDKQKINFRIKTSTAREVALREYGHRKNSVSWTQWRTSNLNLCQATLPAHVSIVPKNWILYHCHQNLILLTIRSVCPHTLFFQIN